MFEKKLTKPEVEAIVDTKLNQLKTEIRVELHKKIDRLWDDVLVLLQQKIAKVEIHSAGNYVPMKALTEIIASIESLKSLLIGHEIIDRKDYDTCMAVKRSKIDQSLAATNDQLKYLKSLIEWPKIDDEPKSDKD